MIAYAKFQRGHARQSKVRGISPDYVGYLYILSTYPVYVLYTFVYIHACTCIHVYKYISLELELLSATHTFLKC